MQFITFRWVWEFCTRKSIGKRSQTPATYEHCWWLNFVKFNLMKFLMQHNATGTIPMHMYVYTNLNIHAHLLLRKPPCEWWMRCAKFLQLSAVKIFCCRHVFIHQNAICRINFKYNTSIHSGMQHGVAWPCRSVPSLAALKLSK